jgi:hypothetical protein
MGVNRQIYFSDRTSLSGFEFINMLAFAAPAAVFAVISNTD